MTESIDDEEVNDIQTQTAETYGVDVDDVTIEVIYETTGSIEIDVADDANINELESVIESEIAELLGLHEGSIEVTIEDGVATYTITSDSVDSAESIQSILDEPSSEAILNEALTGAVALVELSQPVTESMNTDEVHDIQTEVANTYGVDIEEVDVDVVYQTTGTLDLSIGDNIDEDQLISDLENELLALLGLQEGEIEITIENGVATYVIDSNSVETAQEIQSVLESSELQATLDEAVGDDVTIDSMAVDDEITAEIVVTVDTTNAENNLQEAGEALEESFQEQGFVAESNTLPITIGSVDVSDEITADIVVTVDSSGASNNLNTAADMLNDIFEDNGFVTNVESNQIE